MVDTFQTCLDLQPVPPMWGPAAQEGKTVLCFTFHVLYTDLSQLFKLWPWGQWGCREAEKGGCWRFLSILFSSEIFLSH